MFRLIRLFIFFAIILAVLFGFYLWTSRVSHLERFLSKQLDTRVSIKEVELGWGRLRLEGVQLHNPTGSQLSYALRMESISLRMNPFDLWKETLRIKEITVESPMLGIELYNGSGSDNNWARILSSLPPASSEQKTFEIETLILNNLGFQVIDRKGKSIEIPPVAHLEFHNIGNRNALTISQVGRVIFQSILKTLSGHAQLASLLDQVEAIPKNFIEGIRTKSAPPLEEGLDAIKKRGKQATDFLKNLFSS